MSSSSFESQVPSLINVGVEESNSNVEVVSEDKLKNSVNTYDNFHNQNDHAVKVGLFGSDIEDAIKDPETVVFNQENEYGDVITPLLVPAERLEWYNIDLLSRTYGTDKKFYYYTHPPISNNSDTRSFAQSLLKQKLDEGSVIFFDKYQNEDVKSVNLLEDLGPDYEIENLGGGDKKRTANTYIGPVAVKGVADIKNSPPLIKVFQSEVEHGEVSENPDNGVSFAEVIKGDDAKRMWEIYKNPFDELGAEHPAITGFDEQGFADILQDPEVVKIINRVDGKISTLCVFVQDFDHCPWYNKEYFKENYAEYYDTNNILIFPGIVSDEQMRGNNYSLKVIDLATNMLAKRDSNFLVTFECTETSSEYIPTIVTSAVSNSGVAEIIGLEKPISITEYKAVKKVTS
ncbi:MAG TPA: hypothetical protein VLF39_02450 [Candidatus Saccharimonadales bacterium]|nr:hypothetical protein [Candidatus Saccharimonadales bacterium]